MVHISIAYIYYNYIFKVCVLAWTGWQCESPALSRNHKEHNCSNGPWQPKKSDSIEVTQKASASLQNSNNIPEFSRKSEEMISSTGNNETIVAQYLNCFASPAKLVFPSQFSHPYLFHVCGELILLFIHTFDIGIRIQSILETLIDVLLI